MATSHKPRKKNPSKNSLQARIVKAIQDITGYKKEQQKLYMKMAQLDNLSRQVVFNIRANTVLPKDHEIVTTIFKNREDYPVVHQETLDKLNIDLYRLLFMKNKHIDIMNKFNKKADTVVTAILAKLTDKKWRYSKDAQSELPTIIQQIDMIHIDTLEYTNTVTDFTEVVDDVINGLHTNVELKPWVDAMNKDFSEWTTNFESSNNEDPQIKNKEATAKFMEYEKQVDEAVSEYWIANADNIIDKLVELYPTEFKHHYFIPMDQWTEEQLKEEGVEVPPAVVEVVEETVTEELPTVDNDIEDAEIITVEEDKPQGV